VGISPKSAGACSCGATTTLAELHHIFQGAMGWESGHLPSFQLLGKEKDICYASGAHFADDANPVQLRVTSSHLLGHLKVAHQAL
jgi:hypothetical protein